MKLGYWLQWTLILYSAQVSTPAPSIHGMPIVAYLHEDTNVTTEVTCIDCTSTDNSDVEITKLSETPPSGFFNVTRLPGNDAYCLYFDPEHGALNYTDTRDYSIEVQCSDGAATDTTNVQVRVLANELPKITSPQFDYCSIDARTTLAGQMIHSQPITVSDADHDDLTATFTTSPASAAVNYDITKPDPNLDEFTLVAKNDLTVECNSDVTFFVTVSDGKNSPTDPVYVICTVTNHYITPKITNVDKTIYVSEKTAAGHTVLTLETIPADDVTSYTITTNDTNHDEIFSISVAEHALKLTGDLNYEDINLRNISLTIQAKNGYCTPETHTLNVITLDANDPPALNPSSVTLKIYEGFIVINNTFHPVDQDAGNDSFIYTIVGGNEHGIFTIDPKAGAVSSVIDYDVDSQKLPSKQTLTIQVEDIQGGKSYGTLNLEIQDANDNTPEFSATSQQSATFSIGNCTSIGRRLGKRLRASDTVDSSFENNNVVHIVPEGNDYINITASGDIYYIRHLPIGSVTSLTVYAEDGGQYPSPQRSLDPVTITAYSRDCTINEHLANNGVRKIGNDLSLLFLILIQVLLVI